MAIGWMVACGTCVFVATGTAMGVAVVLAVLTCTDDALPISQADVTADGHVTTATLSDKKGGNTRYC